jgi:hypothetical protein
MDLTDSSNSPSTFNQPLLPKSTTYELSFMDRFIITVKPYSFVPILLMIIAAVLLFYGLWTGIRGTVLLNIDPNTTTSNYLIHGAKVLGSLAVGAGLAYFGVKVYNA